ncbi:MAG TPA: VCBS repeat-containing protein, partial [Tepidisphaeraceae bacterium]|nr:VCBS repeat-containing protein [Tepidisphaeraceae bacterium]
MSHPNAGRILIGVVGRVALILLAGSLAAPAASATTPRWSGQGHYRVLVKVEPVNLAKRQTDEMVAQLAIDFAALLKEHDIHGLADLSTIQVHKYDPQTGQPQSFVPFESSLSPYDRPCRFEDNAVPADFPDRLARASVAPGGRGPAEARRRGGRLFNREMDPSLPGTITWVHTQTGSAPSHYAIYFDVKQTPLDCGPSPAPWIGDADIYRLKDGQPLGGLSHFIACVGDYNGDGLFDLLAGAEKGNLMWYPNRGTPGSPRFVGCRMLADEQGPIDLGWYAAPFFFDWDNDGLSDVLVGTSYNTIVWWKNVGAAQSPQLSYRGPVQTDAGPLAVPEGPV